MSNELKLREYLKRVTQQLQQTRQLLLEKETQAHEPIAIVGMSCRYPGGVTTPEDLWALLAGGIDAISSFPEDRGWRLDGLYSPDPDAVGTTYARSGGFLSSLDLFDSGFFGLSPREAVAVGPQHRLLLEASWEAIERAGIDPASLHETLTGVFIGICSDDYQTLAPRMEEAKDGYSLLGTATSIASGRISYTLGLHGPAVSIDTACSSSLVAMHLACQALRAGECSLALAGGASVFSSPDGLIGFSRLKALAPDGRSKAFAAAADGMGWSEGVGVVLLERLSEAKRNGHPVLAVIRGSATNQDGRSQGLTAPNGPAQQRVIRRALESAGLSASDVDVVEAHGTGTALGDPIEAQALQETYGKGHSEEKPLWLGSIKSNIGHTQAAAGVAGVMKVVLAMQKGMLPRTLHAEVASPKIDWSSGTVRLLTEEREWKGTGGPRRAGVSSFGISGTNAHIILEEAPAEASQPEPAPKGAPLLDAEALPLLLSAKSGAALRGQAAQLSAHLQNHPELDLGEVAWSLATTRSLFEHRAVVVAASPRVAVEALDELAAGTPSPSVAVGHAGSSGRLVFVFPGQGSQWVGMARSLLATSEVFRSEIATCSQALAPYIEWSLLDVLNASPGAPSLERVDVVQPVLFAMMVSLSALWRSFGIEPDAVVGHSQGEVAAACVSGALSLEEAAKVVALRSSLLTRLEGRGAMAAAELSPEQLQPYLERYGGRLGLAAHNGPTSTLISGDADDVEKLVQELSAAQIFARRVRVSYASHCSHVDAIQSELLARLGTLHPRRASIPFYSTVLGERLSGEELDAAYWVRNLRNTVRFAQTTDKLIREHHRFFVEVSPHPVLTLALQSSLQAAAAAGSVVASLRSEEGSLSRLLLSLGELHAAGLRVPWADLLPAARSLALPTYAFQRQRYWQEIKGRATDVAAAGLSAADHPLLGALVALADADGLLLTGRLSLSEHRWLSGHQVQGLVLLPGTAFVELALVAAQHVGLGGIEELTLEAPLILPETGGVQLQLAVGAADETGRRGVSIYSREMEGGRSEAPWIRNALGTLRDEPQARFELTSWPPMGATPLDVSGHYQRLAEAGLEYGPKDFQGLVAAWKKGEEVLAEVRLPEGIAQTADGYALHPALFDAALHVLALEGEIGTVELPFAWRGVRLFATGASSLRVRIRRLEGAVAVELADGQGMAVAQVDALTLRPASLAKIQAAQPSMHPNLYRVDWVPLSKTGEAPDGKWGILGEETAEITSALQASGVSLSRYAGLDALRQSLEGGSQAPALVLVACLGGVDPVASGAHRRAHRALALLQQWQSEERLAATRLVFVTRGSIAAGADEGVTDLGNAPLWGLVRTAQTEAAGHAIGLVDCDGSAATLAALPAALGSGEPQMALREGSILVPLLARVREGAEILSAPMEEAWHLDIAERGSLENLRLVPSVQAKEELAPGQVRIAVHAAGVNFRDVLNALGMYPGDPGPLGLEGAGVVTEVGPQVQGLKTGDRVMGMFVRAIGSVAVADHRMIIRMPAGWTFVQGAAIPSVFLTAYYALVDLAGLKAGERVLVHAAAGGVGMAAVQVARNLGAEVYGTASERKWGVLKEQGIEESHLGNSRTLEFGEKFLGGTEGKGVDVVLNSLAREYVDESLRLLPRGGRFIEMGKTDVREPEEIEKSHPGVKYRAFDLGEAGPERIQKMLETLVGMFEEGKLSPLPVRSWDARRAAEAMRYLGQGRNVGKVVLTIPRKMEAEGTVLITGGAGGLGAEVAKHLVREHGVKNLVLCSRQGGSAPGAKELVEKLEEMGARVRVEACDVSQREAVEELLRTIPEEHGLTGVFHSAMVLDDGVLSELDAERIDRVFLPKVDGAQNLHELTREKELAEFVMFSSVAGVVGAAGQGSYAGANAYLDALAAQRRAEGLAGQSLAWGAWGEIGRAAKLTEADQAKVRKKGVVALTPAEGLELLDEAMGRPEAMLVPVRLDLAVMREAGEGVPRILSGLVRPKPRRAAAEGAATGTSLRKRLATMSPGEREKELLELVRKQIAPVLGVRQPEELAASRALKELGLDSLMAVELRNRLSAATELRLPSTLLFDHPTPAALVQKLLKELSPAEGVQPQARAAQRQESKGGTEDPIAIVGMSCRFPGGVATPTELWELLAGGVDAVSSFPGDRGWNVDELYDPDPNQRGKSIVREGGFLYDADHFDPTFFGISPRESVSIDPQQRLLLELSWEAVERAGIRPDALQGSPCGVFVGIIYHDYASRLGEDTGDHEGYLGIGSAGSVASGRIAYTLGLQGPAVSIDTACSSSLVAMHLACQALRAGECSMALAGGVTVMATPGVYIEFSRQRGVAPNGRCKAFAASADGAGFSEGGGMLLLERLSDARRSGHPVLALIRGSATNQDGRSQGLTAPNGPSQERVIQTALESAGLHAADVDAVEAHGTGTTLGDPIEAQALLATYGAAHTEARPLWLGSIKSNIGHTQAAAGVAGVIKMVLAMQKGLLPRTLHVDQPSPHIDWTSGSLRLLTEASVWESSGRPRRAGVSAFGISGSNAHMILEEAPATDPGLPAVPPSSPLPLLISAKTEEALRAQAQRLRTHLERHPEQALVDVAYSLATERTHFEHRAAVVARDRQELLEALDVVASDGFAENVVVGQTNVEGRLVFVFPGYGSLWPEMALSLLRTSAVFRASMEACERAISPHVDWSLLAVLRGEEGTPPMERVDVMQPVLFAMMVSLVALWRSMGIRPDAVVGHSQGEIAAACVAGALSLEDAARLVALRSQLLTRIEPGQGAMAAVDLPVAEMEKLMERSGGRLFVACINSPRSTVVSGDAQAIDALLRELKSREIFALKLGATFASHSPQMEAIRGELSARLAGIKPQPGSIPLYSTVSGDELDGSQLDAGYWYRNLRQPVRFVEATQELLSDGCRFFLEVSPHPVLMMNLQETIEASGCLAAVAFSLAQDEGDMGRLFLSLGELHVRGLAVDWSQALPRGSRVELPTYGFQRQRYWMEKSPARSAEIRPQEASPVEASFWSAVEQGDIQRLAETLNLQDKKQEEAWAEVLPKLSGWRQESRQQSVVQSWRYQVAWAPLTGTVPVRAGLSGDWLLVRSRESGWAEAVTEALTSTGSRVFHVVLERGEEDRGTVARKLQGVLGEGRRPQRVLSLLAMEPRAELFSEIGMSLALVQALGDAGIEAPLWMMTSGAVSIGRSDGLRNPEQAMCWGLGRVVALEHPERWGGLLDVPETADGPSVQRLLAALGNQEHEDQLALRPSGLYTRRLHRAPAEPVGAAAAWKPRGTVLITGGTGGLGSHVARWLAREGAEQLVLMSRRGGQAPGAEELAEELRGLGVKVTLAACDASDRAALKSLLAELKAEGAIPRSVVHAAGVEKQKALAEITKEDLVYVISGKVEGARNLHEVLQEQEEPLDAFITFSSIAGVWGSGQQGVYAAANAYLDALVEKRRGMGMAGTSVAWGLWAGRGMTESEEVQAQLRKRGLAAMEPKLALSALQQALDRQEGPVVVVDLDWARFAPVYAAARPRPLLNEISEVKQALSEQEPASPRERETPLLAHLRPLRPREQMEYVLAVVRGHVAAVLGHVQVAAVDPDRGFTDLGLDSLMAVELRKRLRQELGVALPATLVFDHPTPRRMTGFLLDALGPRLGLAASLPLDAQARRGLGDSEEPIAIVGMALRLPGGVVDLESFWNLLSQGVDAAGPIPASRWNAESAYDPDPSLPGRSYVREGSFIDGIDQFDAGFFGISPREAKYIDPQHRLLLEGAWEALEQAGVIPASLKDSKTGVFVGIGASEYAMLQGSSGDADAYVIQGTASAFAAGRLAFTLGLQGPAMSVDTACSSSLVALHLACKALRGGECDLALAAGVQVMLTPELFQLLSRTRALAPDGRSKTFSGKADGYGRGEGVVVVALERLSEARKKGRPVLAVVKGSAVNHDGESSGITAPNGTSQQKVLKEALHDAGIEAADVDVVECHGTGTVLGDPIEVQALAAVYGAGREEKNLLRLGAVKTNIGHLESGAGLAGVAKMVAALRKEALPATLHSQPRNPHIEWEELAVRVVEEQEEWPRTEGRPRRAGVSAFGFSGTNAHVILEEAPREEVSEPPAKQAGAVVPLLISAKSEAALRGQAKQMAEFLRRNRELGIGEVCAALATKRTHFAHRAVVMASEGGGAADALMALAKGERAAASLQGVAQREGRLAVLFTGQGSQRAGMGRELYERMPAFREELERVCAHFDALLDRPLLKVLFANEGTEDGLRLEQTAYTQPALFAVEVAMYRVWERWGMKPDVLIGHSIGEVSAAHVAGVMTLGEGCEMVAARGRLMQGMRGDGAMAALQVSEGEVKELLRGMSGRVEIAGVNGPEATVVSGDREEVEAIAKEVQRRGMKAKRLAVSHAFHSAHMDGMLEEFRKVVRGVKLAAAKIPIVSNVTGMRAEPEEMRSAEYWVKQARQAVRFAEGVRRLEEEGVRNFLEVGPQGVLCAMVAESLSERGQQESVMVASMRQEAGEEKALGAAVAGLHVRGVELDWSRYFEGAGGRPIALPTYAFQRQRFWIEKPAARTEEARRNDALPDEDRFWSAVERGDVERLSATLSLQNRQQEEAWAAVLPRLSGWRQESRQQGQVQNWRYRVAWAPISLKTRTDLSGAWLLVTGGHDAWSAGLTESLSSAGACVMQVVVDPRGEGRGRLAEKLRHAAGTEKNVRAVISLLAMEQRTESGTGMLTAALALVQALGDAGMRAPLWMLTSGAVSIGRPEVLRNPEQAVCWGLGRVVGLEHPEQWGGLVDVPETVDETSVQRVLQALCNQESEDQLALRAGGLYVRRLQRAQRELGEVAKGWKPRGTVLITGGTGGLGAHVARWVAREGAEHLVLISRRGGATPGAMELEAELLESGARVTLLACDAADRGALRALLSALRAEGIVPASVVHTAGTERPKPLSEITPEDVCYIAAGKVEGAMNLHHELKEEPLDAFITFSSIAGVWGSGQQGVYAAANAYLDALVEKRRGMGMAGTSVAWGPWAGKGLGEHEEVQAQLRKRGLVAMEPKLALSALQQAMDGNEGTLVVADMDWERFAPVYTAARSRPLLSEIPEVKQALSLQQPVTDRHASLLATLRVLSESGRRDRLIHLVQLCAAAILGHEDVSAITPEGSFSHLGLDSLMAVELRRQLQQETGASLPATAVFDHPSPRQLAEVLLSLISPILGEVAPAPAHAPTAARGIQVGLSRSMLDAEESGDPSLAQDLISVATRLRRFQESRDLSSEKTVASKVVRHISGTSGLDLICIPPIVPELGGAGSTGSFCYVRLANALREYGTGNVFALISSGFYEGEPLPDDLASVLRGHAEAVKQCTSGTPFAIVGYSSGGWMAYELAGHLEQMGIFPAAVILLDTLAGSEVIGSYAERWSWLPDEYKDVFLAARDFEVTAGWYYRKFFAGWKPGAIQAPTFLVCCSAPVTGAVFDVMPTGAALLDGWLAAGQAPTTVDLPYHHMNIITDGASDTARVVYDWLAALPRTQEAS